MARQCIVFGMDEIGRVFVAKEQGIMVIPYNAKY